MNLFNFLILLSTFFLASCFSSSRGPSNAETAVKYSDFQNILYPQSRPLTLPGKDESLILMRLVNDKYAKLYNMNHNTLLVLNWAP